MVNPMSKRHLSISPSLSSSSFSSAKKLKTCTAAEQINGINFILHINNPPNETDISKKLEWFDKLLNLVDKPMDLSRPTYNKRYALHGYAALSLSLPTFDNKRKDYLLQRIIASGGVTDELLFTPAETSLSSTASYYPLEWAYEKQQHYKFEKIFYLMLKSDTLTDWNIYKVTSPWWLLVMEKNENCTTKALSHHLPNVDLDWIDRWDIREYIFDVDENRDNLHLELWRTVYNNIIPEYRASVNTLLLTCNLFCDDIATIVIQYLTPYHLQDSFKKQ